MTNLPKPFRTVLGYNIFKDRYAINKNETWEQLAKRVVDNVCGPYYSFQALLSQEEQDRLIKYISEMKFIPAGRYLYYAGRQVKYYNNCFLFRVEDTREGWGDYLGNLTKGLTVGGGAGTDYSLIRPKGSPLGRSGGVASGPISLMQISNEIGRHVKQGGTRRAAILANLDWRHPDVFDLLKIKDWDHNTRMMKQKNFD